MWKSAYSNRKNSNENEIIQFIGDSKLKDRSLLIEYISKLQIGGLYIQHIQSLINFCEEAIVLNIIEQEKIDNQTNGIEENQDDIATWYCGDEIKHTYSKKAIATNKERIKWIPYNFETNKKIECARKNGFNYVGISDTHYLYLKLKLQKSCDRKFKSCLTIKRESPKNKPDEKEEEEQQQQDKQEEFEIESDEDIDDGDDIGLFSSKWFWADDSSSGAQDVWVEYSSELCKQMETAYQKKSKEHIKVDSERYVDTVRMLQVRYDSRYRVRMVKREIPKPATTTKGTLKKIYNLMNVFSISKPTNPTQSPSVDNVHGFKELPFAKTFKKVRVNSIPFILTINQLYYLYRSLLKHRSSKQQQQQQQQQQQVTTSSGGGSDQQSPTRLKLYVLDKFKISLLKNNNILHSIPN